MKVLVFIMSTESLLFEALNEDLCVSLRQKLIFQGRASTKAVISSAIPAEDPVRSKSSPCGICGGLFGIGTFSPITLVLF
jgi:hypothetical protein